MNGSEKLLSLLVMSSEYWVIFKLFLNFDKVVFEFNVITIQKMLDDNSSFLRILSQGDEICMLEDIVFE